MTNLVTMKGSTVTTALAALTDANLLSLWADTMDEMRRRDLIRTANNPVADYGERVVAKRLGLTLQGNSAASYDAIGPDGTRYQIKARRLNDDRSSRQLGILRNLDADGFDLLAIVLFEPDFSMIGIWLVSIEVVREHAVYRAHVNGHVLHARPPLLNDPRVKRVQ